MLAWLYDITHLLSAGAEDTHVTSPTGLRGERICKLYDCVYSTAS